MVHARARKWLKKLLFPGESLSSRVVISGFWVLVLRVVSHGLQLARTVVLARLLAPSDFGLMGITLLVMALFETFSKTGFQSALIQKKDNIDDYLDSAWTTTALRGIVLYGLIFLAAPYAAAFYESPAAEPIIRTAALVLVLEGLMNMRVVYFKRELEFQKQFIYQLSGILADLLVSIAAALILKSIWALVYGLLAGALVRLIMSYVIAPGLPRPRIDLARIRELYGYGRWIFGSGIFVFLLNEGDDALVGKILGISALGFYGLAHRIANLPATEITHVITLVTFPAYARIQDNPKALREAYLRVLKLTALLTIPAAGGIFALAPELTSVLLGDKWLPMVTAMQVLVLYGAVRSIGATMGPVILAVGRPEIQTRYLFVQTILTALIIYPLSMRWNIAGTGVAILLPALVVNTIFAYYVLKITRVRPAAFFKAVGYPLLGTLVMVSGLLLSKTYLPGLTGLAGFLLLVALGAVIYFIIALLLERFAGYRLLNVFRSIRTSLS